MKNLFKNINIALLLVIIALSCSEDSNMDPLGNWELSAPEVNPVPSAIALDETEPATVIDFNWQAAQTSNKFGIAYTFVLVPQSAEDYTNPILSITPGNSGKQLFVSPTHQQIDRALWAACYPAGEAVNLKWVVIAKAIERTTTDSQNITITRFATEYEPATLYITGSGTEAGSDANNATLMRAQKDAEGNITQIFDVYTTLTAGGTYSFRHDASAISKSYGGNNGNLQNCGGPAITVTETAQYRVTVNLTDHTYELLKIEKWSLVGDAVEGGWGGDVPLAYKGNGVWESKVDFVNEANFIFRANGDWDYIIKRIQGTATPNNKGGKVIMESEAAGAGVTFEDVPSTATGIHTVTLNLSANGYSYALVPDVTTPAAAVIGESANPAGDKVSGNFPFGTYTAPDQLFLVSDGAMVAELTKDGNTFTSVYLALEQGKTYKLNSAADGSGTTYNNLGDGSIGVVRDQAYKLTVNFTTGTLAWTYYNIKLFHWNNDGGWDDRQEIPMTYSHPYKFEVASASLTGGFDSKFNSPWEVQFTTSSTALSGTMTNGAEGNYKGIVQSGNYKATIVVDNTYETCTYEFVKL